MHSLNDTARFLQAVFQNNLTLALFANLNPPNHTRDHTRLDTGRDCYWSIAAFPAGVTSNCVAGALDVRALVIDDVGSKVVEAQVKQALGAPTAVVETSFGNFQWVYRLAAPVPVDQWKGFFRGVEAVVGCTLDGSDAVHLFRLPAGVNTKAGKNGFRPRLVELDPGIAFDTRSITPCASGPSVTTATASSVSRIHDIKSLVELLPNDSDYQAWIARMHQIRALALREDEAREAFHEWSSRWSLGVYDEDTTEKKWQSLRETHTPGLEILVEAERANKAAFEKIMNAEAGASFDDGSAPPDPVAAPNGGPAFRLTSKGDILLTMENAARALTGLGIVCRHDDFHHRVFITYPDGKIEKLTDHAVLLLRDDINTAYGKDFGPIHVGDAIVKMALRNRFNPVVDMLREAEMFWDGIGRLDRLGPDYFHTEDTAFAREAFRKVMIAAVRRARSPGCKFDQILVIESPEGWDKSSAWEVLAGRENFSDAPILGKDARAVQEELADIWIHEIADLSGLTKAEVEHVKAFASRTNDRARAAYGKYLTDQPRQSVEVGTTNSDAYLMSTTGNRRFWTLRMSARVEIARLKADRMLLWGEAAAAESGGESLVLDKKLWGTAADEQEKRRVIDPWEHELANLSEVEPGLGPQGSARLEARAGSHFISGVSINEYLAGYRRQSLTSGSGRKIAEIMKRLGWSDTRIRINGVPTRGYTRPISAPASGSAPPSGTPSGTKNVF